MSAGMHEFQSSFVKALLGAPEPTLPWSRQPGFDVYRNTVLRGAIDALAANVPSVHRLLGDDTSTLPPAPSFVPGCRATAEGFATARRCPTSSPRFRSSPTSTTSPASPRSTSPGSSRSWRQTPRSSTPPTSTR